ncbi:TetR/AcrR family transcriptional regulator [Xylanimonas protaetiae]|uniref:TetR/AcrR family transcriptional regulator n=1 Tax=Xylanimonas protaetiae TaxID=2509457 RepID=A0A4P6F1U0_9MICO|nr:TetR/AcrR family transcriptional regulator [Xylanimonas protaetiae]QAY69472.1 TetR/AcrR family transcriptional regulator [Xylanimonas protaetiae]
MNTTADAAAPALTGARARTHRLILDTAVAQLAKDSSASLGQIADAAGIGRTTLYRYFPERADLLAALGEDARARFAAAHERAALTEGSAIGAIERLCQEYVELSDLLALYFTETLGDNGIFDEDAFVQADLRAVVERGRADGTIDAELSTEWVVSALGAFFYATWEVLSGTTASRYDVVRQLLRTVRKTLAA